MGLLDKITSIGTLALVGIAGYLVWANWETIRKSFCSIPGADLAFPSFCTAEDKQTCPGGTWENKDHTCCPTGSVYEGGICKNVNMPVCPPGTLWRDGQCVPYDVDIPGTCTLPEKWDPILKKCIDPNKPGMRQCPNGMWMYNELPCPGDTTEEQCGKFTGKCTEALNAIRSALYRTDREWLCKNQDVDLHTWIAEFMPYDYAEVLRLCNTSPKPETNIQKCPDGTLVDLNNPPGTTLEEACTYINPGACKIPMFDAMRGCGQTLPGKKLCCGPQNVCNAFGSDIPYQGCFLNAAQLNYYNCLNNACGW